MSNQDAWELYKQKLITEKEKTYDYKGFIISHSLFSKTYYLTDDNVSFQSLDNNDVMQAFEPANISYTNAANDNDLTQTASFTVSDLDNVLDDELDRLPLNDSEDILVTVLQYTSESEYPAEFLTYTAKSVTQDDGVFTISCGAPDLNKDQTGEVYSLDRFPMLRGYS